MKLHVQKKIIIIRYEINRIKIVGKHSSSTIDFRVSTYGLT